MNPLKLYVPFSCCGLHEHALVTECSQVRVNESKIDCFLGDTVFDIRLQINSHFLYVDLYHHHKPPKLLDVDMLNATQSGVLGIDCDEFHLWLVNNRDNTLQKYSELVFAYLIDANSKSWLFHPKSSAAK